MEKVNNGLKQKKIGDMERRCAWEIGPMGSSKRPNAITVSKKKKLV